jgi:hypothetical protein
MGSEAYRTFDLCLLHEQFCLRPEPRCVLCASAVILLRKIITTETQSTLRMHREKQILNFPTDPSRVRAICSLRSGGLRYAATTSYYLIAFQAENTFAVFSHDPGSDWVALAEGH